MTKPKSSKKQTLYIPKGRGFSQASLSIARDKKPDSKEAFLKKDAIKIQDEMAVYLHLLSDQSIWDEEKKEFKSVNLGVERLNRLIRNKYVHRIREEIERLDYFKCGGYSAGNYSRIHYLTPKKFLNSKRWVVKTDFVDQKFKKFETDSKSINQKSVDTVIESIDGATNERKDIRRKVVGWLYDALLKVEIDNSHAAKVLLEMKRRLMKEAEQECQKKRKRKKKPNGEQEVDPKAKARAKLRHANAKLRNIQNLPPSLHMDSFGYRIYSPYSKLNSELRKAIRIYGESVTQLDVSNCAPYMLGAEVYNKKKTDDAERFLRHACTGKFYEFIQEEVAILEKPIDRNQVKKLCQYWLYGEIGQKIHKSIPVIIGLFFPTVNKHLEWLKTNPHKYSLPGSSDNLEEFAHKAASKHLHFLDSTYMLEHVANRIRMEYPDEPIITVHDALLCRRSFAAHAKEVMEACGTTMFGFKPHIDCDDE